MVKNFSSLPKYLNETVSLMYVIVIIVENLFERYSRKVTFLVIFSISS